MLKYYISFWREWREVLLDGKLTATNPECEYSLVCSSLGEKEVYTAYSDRIIPVKANITVAVNATGEKSLIIKNAMRKAYTVINCMGEELAKGSLQTNLEEISVPTAGMIFVE